VGPPARSLYRPSISDKRGKALRTASFSGLCSGTSKNIKDTRIDWLPFLDTYRTMCLAPQPEFRQLLEQARDVPIAA
jgi:hypothetical protein